MTKLSFINNNPDDRRLTIRKLSNESIITPLAEVLNSYTLCPDRVGFCLGPYVKPIELPTIEIKDTSLFDGFVTDRLDIELVSNYSTLPAGWTIEPVFKVAGEQPITDQFSYDAKSPLLLQGIELVKAAVNTTFSVAFKLLNKGKLIMTTEYKSFTIATDRASNDTSRITLRNSAGYGVELSKATISNDYSRDNPAIYGSKYIALWCYKPLLIIGDRAFKDQLISELSFIPNLKQIGNEAFMNNQLETVTIYGGITKIGDRAFAGNPLRFVGVIENTPPTLGVDAFPASLEVIYVPDAAVNNYISKWNSLAALIKPLSTVVGLTYKPAFNEYSPDTYFVHYFIGETIPENFLVNTRSTILSISEGVTTIGGDGLYGNSTNYLKIPSSLTTVDGAGLNFSAQILEFEEGLVDTAFMVDSRPDANVVILPSTMTELTGWVIGNVPRVIVSKAAVPPTLGVWDAYSWNANNTEYRTSLGSWYSRSGTGCDALYVPAESIEAYRNDPRWKMYTDNIRSLDELVYGNVKKIKMTTSGVEYQISGTTDLASVGKEVTIRYYESLYNSNTGRNVPTNVLSYSAIVGVDGTFNVNVPMRDTLANHYIDAVIGAGNLLITNSRA